MPRATRHYRLRVRSADDTSDALILCSVPGGTNPYLTGPPQGDGQEIDPATGESSIGAYTIEAADVNEIVTAALVDGAGRQTLIQRRAYIELSVDGGSSWPTVLIPGFINAYRLVTPMRWAFTVGESRRIEYTRQVWDRTTDKFERATCLIGEPIKGNWGPMVDHGGWRFVVTASDSDTVTLHFHCGHIPSHETTPSYQNATPLESDFGALTAFARDQANQLASAEVVEADAYPGIVVLVQTEAGVELDRFKPVAQVAVAGSLPHVLLTRMDEIKLLRADTVWAGSPPSNGTIFRLYAWRTTIGEDNPLHIEGHPIDIQTDLWDEAGIAYDSTEAAAVRGALGVNTRLTLRITEPWTLRDVEQMMGGLFGFGTRVGTDGELELITTRIRGIAAPASLYDDDDLRSPETVIFEVDEESIYNTVTVEQLQFERWGSGMGERPADDVVALPRVRSLDLNSEGGATPDSDTFGIRELRYEVPGVVKIDVSGPGLGDRDFEAGLATEIFDRFGRGGVYCTVAALPTITEKVGEELRLDVSHLPNAGVRGGERILQVVRRTETPSGPQLLLLDSGANSQFGTLPTFSVAAGAADARKYVDVTITNAAALNTAGAWLRVEWAVAASEPSSGSPLKGYGPGEIPGSYTTPPVDAGSHVWLRMQAKVPDKRSTAYTAWQHVDLTDLTAPSGLSDSAGSDPARITITFTPGESDIPLEVLQRPQGNPAVEARVVDSLSPGSDRVTLTLVPGNNYTIGIRHRERAPFSGVSSTTETSFTVAGAPDTLPAPTQPFALGIKWATGSLAGSSGVEPQDWPEDPSDQYAVGLRVRSAIDDGFIEFEMATETAVGSGIPGSYSAEETRSVTGVGETYVFTIAVPLDGKLRYLRARHVRVGATASSYTSVVSVLPGEILSPAPPVDPLDITGIVPVTLGGTGVADPTSGVLLLGAAASPTTELAPGVAGGYARSNGSAWARSGLLATDLSGTIPSARLSGVYSGITGLGTQAQALVMGGNAIINAGAIAATTGAFSGLLSANLGLTVASGQTLTLTGATVAGTPTWSSAQAITLSTAAQPNITSVGTLTSLTVSGAASTGALTATTVVAGTDPGGSELIRTNSLGVRDGINVDGSGAVGDVSQINFTSSRARFGYDGVRSAAIVYAGGGKSIRFDPNATESVVFHYDGTVILGTDPTGAQLLRVGGDVKMSALSATTGTFSGDVTIGDLGVFDSTDTPTDRQLLLYNNSISKWQAEDIQLAWGGSDVKAAVLADNTAVTYILADPGTGADSPVGAPSAPSAPTLYGAHESITLEVVGYSRPADFRYFEWRYSEDNFVADDHALATTTSDKIVHARLDNTTTYYYKVRATDRAGNSSAYSSVSSTTPTANGAQAFGVILAAEIGVASLAAIQANIGIITAGQMRDSTNVYGINLGGAGGIPGTWNAGVNFENTAVSTMDRYINFYEGATGGLDSFIKHEQFDLKHDGTAIFSGQVDILEGTLTGGAFGDKHIFIRDPALTHGMTGIVETDVAGAIGLTLAAGSTSGMGLVGFSIGNRGLSLGAVATTPLTSMGSLAVMTFESWKKSGTSRGVLADGELAFSWHNGTTALMALWGDGSLVVAGPATLRYDASNYSTFAVASAGDLSITCTGTDPDRFGIILGATERMAVDDTAVSGNTSVYLYDPAISGLSRVKVGANGTGPTGNTRALYLDEIPV